MRYHNTINTYPYIEKKFHFKYIYNVYPAYEPFSNFIASINFTVQTRNRSCYYILSLHSKSHTSCDICTQN